ncbi:hypothetical protein ACB092_11G045200 [Castanea dentata]
MRFSLISLTRNPLRTYISKSFPNTITFHIKKALHIDCLHLLLASIYFIEVLHTGMGRKRRLEFVEPGESSSRVGLNEVQSRQQAPLTDDDRRHSQRSDDETQPPDPEAVPAAGVVNVPNKCGPNRFDDI